MSAARSVHTGDPATCPACLPTHPHPEFLALLSDAEQCVAAGAVNEAFVDLVRQLSDLAIEPGLARYLEVDRTTRWRWDAVFAFTDPEALLTDARAKARALIVEAEELLASVQVGTGLAGVELVRIVRQLQTLEQTVGLPSLYGGEPDWADRADVAIQAVKEARS